ncbi:MAG: hypothetical protein WC026_17270 [Hyphomicrobium sp.]|uniref:hypothetical protein n=1 Tax=Hyphomicrobium sp. TaxID=82 RepID=UPI0035614977
MSDDFKDYLFEYRFGNSWWGATIRARSPTEAKERLSAIAFAQYRGEVKAKIAVPCGSIVSKVIDWMRGDRR